MSSNLTPSHLHYYRPLFCVKSQQNWQLEMAEIHSLAVLERQSADRVTCQVRAPGENFLLASSAFQWCPASPAFWLCHISFWLHGHMASFEDKPSFACFKHRINLGNPDNLPSQCFKQLSAQCLLQRAVFTDSGSGCLRKLCFSVPIDCEVSQQWSRLAEQVWRP